MKQESKMFQRTLSLFFLFAALLAPIFLGSAQAEMKDIEKYIRAQVDIGEAMFEFMRQQSGKERSMELMEQWEKEINAMVAEILGSYGLTKDEYNKRKNEVLADKEAIEAFLDEHPDLKERYNMLPFHGGSGGRGPH